jgi:hypothetical protein
MVYQVQGHYTKYNIRCKTKLCLLQGGGTAASFVRRCQPQPGKEARILDKAMPQPWLRHENNRGLEKHG